jgi:hypothetical protein
LLKKAISESPLDFRRKGGGSPLNSDLFRPMAVCLLNNCPLRGRLHVRFSIRFEGKLDAHPILSPISHSTGITAYHKIVDHIFIYCKFKILGTFATTVQLGRGRHGIVESPHGIVWKIVLACRNTIFMSDRESDVPSIRMKLDRESDAKSYLWTALKCALTVSEHERRSG